MFYPKPQTETRFDAEINRALEQLTLLEPKSEEYNNVLERMSKLHKLKSEEEQNRHKFDSDNRLKPPSLDTVLTIAANLIGILWITRYERENVITTKSPSFALKLR